MIPLVIGSTGRTKQLQSGETLKDADGEPFLTGDLIVIPPIPTGGVVPYVGVVAPSGYLLCDGSIIDPSVYPVLCSVLSNQVSATPVFNTGTSRVTCSGYTPIVGDCLYFSITTGSLPSGVAQWQPYYAVPFGGGVFGLASSLANALTSTCISFGLAGSGDQVLVLCAFGATPYGGPPPTAPPYMIVPDLRSRFSVGAGQGVGLTSRALGSSGGEESHLLTASESGLPAHTHSVSPVGTEQRSGASTSAALCGGDEGGSFSVTALANSPLSASSAHNTMPPFLGLNYIIKT